jgi:tripartite-type tricarboxylate transporter receptor subunit TctC
VTRLAMLWVLAALLCANSLGFGQAFPNRPIRMVVPFPAGGSIDVVARAIVQNWVANLNQQIVIDNRGGAGGTLGTELVAKAPADGYTILYGNAGPLSIGPHLYTKPGYDLFKDFAPVSQVTSSPFMIFATASLPVNTVDELISYAKARPGQLNYASSGVGSGLHLMGELFKSVTGINIVHVPFKGVSQALSELFTGRVQLAVSTVAGLAVHVKAGRMKGIVSSGAHRSPQLPEVPTCIEAGIPGFHSTSWHAIVAPAGTPKPVILKLQQTLAATLANPELREQLMMKEDAEPVASSPEELARFLRSESAKWAKVIKTVGVKVE